jgi:hypothetical protein
LAKQLEKDSERRRASEFLFPSLDDWHLRTREAAIDALDTIGDPSSIEPLRRVASTDKLAAVRDRANRAADRIAARAAKPSETQDAAEIMDLKRRLESLEKELEATKKKLTTTPPAHAAGSD